MTEYWTQFSTIVWGTDEEISYLERMLRVANAWSIPLWDYVSLQIDWYRLKSNDDIARLHIFGEEHPETDVLAKILQRWLKRFDLDRSITIDEPMTCSKMLPYGFGYAAYVITKDGWDCLEEYALTQLMKALLMPEDFMASPWLRQYVEAAHKVYQELNNGN